MSPPLSGLPDPQRLERHLQHLRHPRGGGDLPQQGRLPAGALPQQPPRGPLPLPVHPLRGGLQDVRGEGVRQGAAEDLPGGGGAKLPLEPPERAPHHEDRAHRLPRGQSAHQVQQTCKCADLRRGTRVVPRIFWVLLLGL